MRRQERLELEEERSISRSLLSNTSRRLIAEKIHHGETEKALQELFRVLSGESVSDYPPQRDVLFDVKLSEQPADGLSGEFLVWINISVGEKSIYAGLPPGGEGEYIIPSVSAGEYDATTTVDTVVSQHPQDGKEVVYNAQLASVSSNTSTVTVNPSEVDFGDRVEGGTITVEAVELGDKL